MIVVLSGMENYRVSISKKLQTDTGKSKFMSGAEAMTYLLPMVKVWKCVLKEQLPISETGYVEINLCFSYRVMIDKILLCSF